VLGTVAGTVRISEKVDRRQPQKKMNLEIQGIKDRPRYPEVAGSGD
jgi:hypothetical protein